MQNKKSQGLNGFFPDCTGPRFIALLGINDSTNSLMYINAIESLIRDEKIAVYFSEEPPVRVESELAIICLRNTTRAIPEHSTLFDFVRLLHIEFRKNGFHLAYY